MTGVPDKAVDRGSRDTHGTHGHTDHTNEPHNHPNPPTHPRDRETTESAADSTAAAPERTGKKTPGGTGTMRDTHETHGQTNLTAIRS
jgi:hypothetical protein